MASCANTALILDKCYSYFYSKTDLNGLQSGNVAENDVVTVDKLTPEQFAKAKRLGEECTEVLRIYGKTMTAADKNTIYSYKAKFNEFAVKQKSLESRLASIRINSFPSTQLPPISAPSSTSTEPSEATSQAVYNELLDKFDLNKAKLFLSKLPDKPTAVNSGYKQLILDLIEANLPRSVTPSAPVEVPPKLGHKNNSCFLAVMMWTLFLNEPIIQQELDNTLELLQEGEQYEALLKVKDLIMHCKKCQASGKSVEADRITVLREVLNKLNPHRFVNSKSTEQEDITEALNVLMDQIFEFSSLKQNLTTTRQYDLKGMPVPHFTTGLTATGLKQSNPELSRGNISLSLEKGPSIKGMLAAAFSYEGGDPTKYRIEGSDPKAERAYTLLKTQLQFEKAPPLLLLDLQRFTLNSKITSPIDVGDGKLVLEGRFFEDGVAAVYELSSVMKHNGTRRGGHYTASINKAGSYFHCDDARGSVVPINQAQFIESANKEGYVLVYRKIG